MKKTLNFLALAIGLLLFSEAQGQSISSIGVRLGGGFNGGSGAEINGRFGDGSGRIEGALSWSRGDNSSSLFISGVYQIVVPIENSFSYYYGAGVALGYYSYDFNNESDNSFLIGVPTQLGIEYDFSEIPLNLSLDIRPIVTIRSEGVFVPISVGLGIRYLF